MTREMPSECCLDTLFRFSLSTACIRNPKEMSLTMLRTSFLGLALAHAGFCQPERFLDVTKLHSPQGGGSLSVGMGTHQPPPKTSPLRITLLSLDKDTKTGKTVSTNPGAKSVSTYR